jgi:hypothetical protein
MILASVTGLAMAPALRGKVPYDPIRDFVPVAQVVDAATLFSAHPSSVSKTLGDLVARAKKEPGTLIVGNPGIGSVGHLDRAHEQHLPRSGFVHHDPSGKHNIVMPRLWTRNVRQCRLRQALRRAGIEAPESADC